MVVRWPGRATPLLVALSVIVFFALEFGGGAGDPFVLTLFGAKERGLVLDGQVWRLLATTFLHSDVVHLLMNVVAIFFLGRTCESLFGARRFVAIYFAAAVGGAAASTLASPHLAVGASGAVFGIIGALFVFGIVAKEMFPPDARRRFFLFFAIWLALSIWMGIAMPVIDSAAHAGGGIAGGVLAALMLRGVRGGEALRAFAADDRRWRWPVAGIGLATAATCGMVVLSVVDGGVQFEAEDLEAHRLDVEGFQVSLPRRWKTAGTAPLLFVDPRGLTGRMRAVPLQMSPVARLDSIIDQFEDTNLKVAARRTIQAAGGVEAHSLTAVVTAQRDASFLATYVLIPLGDRAVQLELHGAPGAGDYMRRVAERVVATVSALPGPQAQNQKTERWITLVRARMELARASSAASDEETLASPEMNEALGFLETSYRSTKAPEIEQLLTEFYKTVSKAWERELAATKSPTSNQLNRLAWVYATAAIDAYRRPGRAVRLALDAVEKSRGRRAEFIDTLAEAYYASGDSARARETIDRAVALKPGHAYYLEQSERLKVPIRR